MSKRPASQTGKQPTFEEALAQVEAIIERIESGQAGLEESLAEYERGVSLIQHCRSRLSQARQQVEDLTRRLGQADDTPTEREPDEDASAETSG